MARDGSGNYVLPTGNPVTPGTVIESDWANTTLADLAVAITQSIAYDGQTLPVANLPMNGYRHTGVGDPTARDQYATMGMVQDNRQGKLSITGGLPNNLTTTVPGQMTAYAPGSLFTFTAQADNTGPMTLDINSIGPKSIVTPAGAQLVAGDVQTGITYLVMYDGAAFRMITTPSGTGTVVTNLEQNCITGWDRPGSGTFPVATIVNGTTVEIPSGRGRIIPPGEEGVNNVVEVVWAQQQVVLTNLATQSATTIAADAGGSMIQIAGSPSPASLRDYIVICTVAHFNGVITNVATRPAIFGDNGYLFRDATGILSRIIVSGGRPSQGTQPLRLTISSGQAFIPGVSSNDVSSPNILSFPTQTDISFFTLSGTATIGPAVQTAPVTLYDPNGNGVTQAMSTAVASTIHRLYFLYGTWIWVYGQFEYTDLATAAGRLNIDRALYVPSPRVEEAVLVCEIIAQRGTTALSNTSQCILVPRGGFSWSIGSAGSIDEAPQDDETYGRRNGAWTQTIARDDANFVDNATITTENGKYLIDNDPVGAAGWSGLGIYQEGIPWFNIEVTYPDDKVYFRSYNPATGVLRHTMTWDLATGAFTFPGDVAVTGALNVVGASTATPPAQFDNSTRVATTSWVKNNGLSFGGFYSFSTTTVLTSAHVGRIGVIFGGPATITLPNASGVRIGDTITLVARVEFTLATQGGNLIFLEPTAAQVGSIVVKQGMTLFLEATNTSLWQIYAGTGQIDNISTFETRERTSSTGQLATTQFVMQNRAAPNLLDNGLFQVWQRGNFWGAAPSGTFVADRWKFTDSSSAVFTVNQVTSGGFRPLRVVNTTAGTGGVVHIEQGVEAGTLRSAINSEDNTLTVQLTFSIRATFTYSGTVGLQIVNAAGTLALAQAPLIPIEAGSNVYSVTGNLNISNFTMADTELALRCRILYFGAGLASGIELAGSVADLYWAKLEFGPESSGPFQQTYAEELARCQRYYAVIASSTGGTSQTVCHAVLTNSTESHGLIEPPVPMRTTPTIVVTTPTGFNIVGTSGVSQTISAISFVSGYNPNAKSGMIVKFTHPNTVTGTDGVSLLVRNSTGLLAFSAELI